MLYEMQWRAAAPSAHQPSQIVIVLYLLIDMVRKLWYLMMEGR